MMTGHPESGCAGPRPPPDTTYSSELHALIPQRLPPPSSVSQTSYVRAATLAVLSASGRSRLAGHVHAGTVVLDESSQVEPSRPAASADGEERAASTRTHLPPADERTLPAGVEDDVRAAAVVKLRRRVERRCMRASYRAIRGRRRTRPRIDRATVALMSQPETVTLTREQLYDLVWSKPMTEIAAEFGVSSVAFAKHCKKLGVPRPSRGYWQQLQWGQGLERDSLPPRTSATLTSIVIVKHELREGTPPASSAAPKVLVSSSLRNPHPVIAQLQQELRGSWRRQDGESVAGAGHPVFSAAGPATHRGLRILDALFKALDERGHTLRLCDAPRAERRRRLEVIVAGKPSVEIWLTDHLDRSEHVMTDKERRDVERSEFLRPSKYDLTPSGHLILEIGWRGRSEVRRMWRDTPKRRLEDLVGEAVVAIEAWAELLRRDEAKREEEHQRRVRAEERRRAEDRRRAHRRALGRDLKKVARAWQRAQGIRDFLEAMIGSVPKHAQTERFNAWFSWATVYAERIDPLQRPAKIAKALAPEGDDAGEE